MAGKDEEGGRVGCCGGKGALGSGEEEHFADIIVAWLKFVRCFPTPLLAVLPCACLPMF